MCIYVCVCEEEGGNGTIPCLDCSGVIQSCICPNTRNCTPKGVDLTVYILKNKCEKKDGNKIAQVQSNLIQFFFLDSMSISEMERQTTHYQKQNSFP